jgi:MFS family permease
MSSAVPSEPPKGTWLTQGVFRHRGFRYFWISRFFAVFASQIVSVAVGWQIYSLTRNPFDLGLVGLVQFAPALMLVLVTGNVSDRFNRRAIVGISQLAEGIVAAGLLALTFFGVISATWIFVLLFCFGVSRAFLGPASSSLVPNLVPTEDLASAVAVSSSSWQIATIVGPVAGGLLYGLTETPEIAYTVAFLLFIAGASLMTLVPRPAQKIVSEPRSWTTIVAGFRYIWKEKVVLGAISLDLFAVLLGGAVALLPAYARDILHVGPWGLGVLRSASGVGAIVVAVYLTWFPIRDHAGRLMFLAVGLFGLFILIFGISTTVWLSALALALAGAADMVSVYIRETLIQLWTPDALRGRVSAVNNVFVGASNELGEFRAGTMAAFIGVVPAVLVGGAGTLLVAALWAVWFPDIRKVRHLDGRV